MKTLAVGVPVGVLTAAIMLWRRRAIGAPWPPQTALFSAIVFGFIAKGVYLWMTARWTQTGTSLCLWLALGLAAVLSVGAFVGLPMMKRGGALEFTAINFLWAGGFGWLLPKLVG